MCLYKIPCIKRLCHFLCLLINLSAWSGEDCSWHQIAELEATVIWLAVPQKYVGLCALILVKLILQNADNPTTVVLIKHLESEIAIVLNLLIGWDLELKACDKLDLKKEIVESEIEIYCLLASDWSNVRYEIEWTSRCDWSDLKINFCSKSN